MPILECPDCRQASEAIDWKDVPKDARNRFRTVCPRCGRDFDISEPVMRLGTPRPGKSNEDAGRSAVRR